MAQGKKKNNNKSVRLVVGFVTLVLGVTLILAWWPDVVSLFKGLLGMVLALAGLIILYMVKE